MTTENFKNWLKLQIDVGDGIAVGSIDGNKTKFIGVYDGRPSGNRQIIAVGGLDSTTHSEKQVRILVHWTNSPVQAETKAREIYGLMQGDSRAIVDGVKVYSMDPGKGPISLGRDDKGICEYVIEITIIHERN